MKESYSVIIEFRYQAHTAKQFVHHPPKYPGNLSNSVIIIVLNACKRLPKVFLKKPRIEPTTPGLQGRALIHYTTAAVCLGPRVGSLCASVCVCFVVACWGRGGGLASWPSFVVSNCEFVTFPLVSWVRCGT